MVLESKEILVCGVFRVFLRAGLCSVLSLGHAYHVSLCSALLPGLLPPGSIFLWFTGVSGRS